ncbi:MAG: DUF4832 domain-containing protein [Balneolales bacterium]
MKDIYNVSAVLTILLVSLFIGQCDSARDLELTNISYEPTDEIFPNPERGFYVRHNYTPGGSPLDVETLMEGRDENITQIGRSYYIEEFRNSDLSQDFLDLLEEDFEAIREAGVKTYLRFRYSVSIGDPDAPLDRVLSHIEQLGPTFQRNYDVISFLQGGFIGAWGEWHASTNNLEEPENMRAILFKMLDVLPEERSVVVRSPRHKMNVFETNHPFTDEQAYDGSNTARTGHHNDCFLASPTDVGTYVLGRYPNFDLEDSITVDWIKNYLSQENKYLPMGGETCNPRPDAGDRFHCENALEEMEWLRFSYLNRGYSRQILDTWVDQGCMPEVQRRLGYRFAMLNGSFSQAATPGGIFHVNLDMINEGFASPYNPRGLQIVLRSVDNPSQVWKVDLPDDPRYWHGGESIRLSHELGIPEGLSDGAYEVLLNLPDPAENLRHRPEYAIRLANAGTWEEATGFNRLNHRLIIDSSAGGRAYSGDLTFEPFDI